jgi:hypothetical protein
MVGTNNVNGYFEPLKWLCDGSRMLVIQANRAFFISLSREFGRSEISVSIQDNFATLVPRVMRIESEIVKMNVTFSRKRFRIANQSER